MLLEIFFKEKLSSTDNFINSGGNFFFPYDLIITNSLYKWQPTPVFLPGESQGGGSLVGCRLWGRTESDTTEVT